jgi:glycerol-3-phosphate dehydrogenase
MNGIYDLIIVGGGIHGVGVAQAGAAAGYRTLLLEKEQLAAGTSSRSSKLIHGGLRYLEHGRIGLVRELLRERALLLKNAPELVHLEPFFIPIYRQTRRRPWQVGLGLFLYTLLGGGGFRRLPKSEWGRLDGLRLEGLQAVLQYRDARTDDAGLTRAVMGSAVSLGAELRCPATFVAAAAGKESLLVTVEEAGRRQILRGRTLVNAAGPWVNPVLARISPAIRPLPVELVQGAHIVIDAPPVSGFYYLEARQDGRGVFVMPWRQLVLIGSTESLYHGEPDAVQPLPEEIGYLQQVVRDYFPGMRGETVEQFAGLRVLPTGAGGFWQRSRAVVLHRAEPVPQVLTIYGGKLTDYRVTAVKVLKMLQPLLPPRNRVADTADLVLNR